MQLNGGTKKGNGTAWVAAAMGAALIVGLASFGTPNGCGGSGQLAEDGPGEPGGRVAPLAVETAELRSRPDADGRQRDLWAVFVPTRDGAAGTLYVMDIDRAVARRHDAPSATFADALKAAEAEFDVASISEDALRTRVAASRAPSRAMRDVEPGEELPQLAARSSTPPAERDDTASSALRTGAPGGGGSCGSTASNQVVVFNSASLDVSAEAGVGGASSALAAAASSQKQCGDDGGHLEDCYDDCEEDYQNSRDLCRDAYDAAIEALGRVEAACYGLCDSSYPGPSCTEANRNCKEGCRQATGLGEIAALGAYNACVFGALTRKGACNWACLAANCIFF